MYVFLFKHKGDRWQTIRDYGLMNKSVYERSD
jgi:hypothetical protein